MTDSPHDSAWTFTIWGSRGSVPVSSDASREFGGHTTCLELDLPAARILVDAGSGIADLARSKPHDRKPTLLLFSHLHWDHVLGLPFYAPLFQPGWTLDVRGVPRSGRAVFDAVTELNQPPLFPVPLATSIRADVSASSLDSTGSLAFGGASVDWMEVAHPGGCSAFAFNIGGRKIVFTGDIELHATDRDALLRFCRGAEVLICDAQYTEDEYATRRGWGHSTNLQAAQFAADAGVARLVLTHHDPAHDDAFVSRMVLDAAALFPHVSGATTRMVVARG